MGFNSRFAIGTCISMLTSHARRSLKLTCEKTAASMHAMGEEQIVYECARCGRRITKEEYETYSGLCEECREIEIDELDFEDEYG